MQSDHPALAKVRKLLAKAENEATTLAEAEAYTAKAAQLIADYGIDAALLSAEASHTGSVTDRVVHLEAPYARDKAELLATVAVRLRCRAVNRRERRADGTLFSVHLFGHAPDLERTELLFTSLLLQSATWLAATEVPPREHKAAFRRSWMAGFRAAVDRRLTATERAAEEAATARAGGGSATLVLRNRTSQVEEAMSIAYPHLRAARTRRLSGTGLYEGWAAGQNADLGGARVHAGKRRMLPR